jgi:hypothetical protein
MLHQIYQDAKNAILIVMALILLSFTYAHAEENEPDHAINVSAISCMATDSASNPVSGYVDFIVASWSNEPGEGENDDILVQYQIETQGGYVSGYHDYMHGKFTEAGHYRFSDTLLIGGNVKRVSLIVTAVAAWGDDFQGGQMTYLEIRPTNCDGVTAEPITGEPMHNRLWLPIVSSGAARAKEGPPEIGDPVSVFLSTVYLPVINK